jgi:hypothetical protein
VIRTADRDGTTYVSVTSAMKAVKERLGEEADSYGPAALMKVHCAEGEGCHRVCLDWLAHQAGWLPEYHPPMRPPEHPDGARWTSVLCAALEQFQAFCLQYAVEPIGIEQESFGTGLMAGIVGHLDLFCWLDWRGRRVKAIMDLKFVAKILETHFLQVRTYYRLPGFREASVGLLFHGNRDGGEWKVGQVDLNKDLDDVMAVAREAQQIIWAMRKRGER